MNEDRFKTLLTTALAEQEERLALRLEKSLEQKLEQKLNQKFDERDAALFGKFVAYFEQRFEDQRNELAAHVDRLYALVDGLSLRVETDGQERAIIVHQQERHAQWINQLAVNTGTKLLPEP